MALSVIAARISLAYKYGAGLPQWRGASKALVAMVLVRQVACSGNTVKHSGLLDLSRLFKRTHISSIWCHPTRSAARPRLLQSSLFWFMSLSSWSLWNCSIPFGAPLEGHFCSTDAAVPAIVALVGGLESQTRRPCGFVV